MEKSPISVNDEWRTWIAEGLLSEIPPGELLSTMIAGEIAPEEAQHEIDLALGSP